MISITLTATDLTTVEKAADLAVKWPITVGFFVILLAVMLSLRWVATVGWPRWQAETEARRVAIVEEAAKTRQHMADLLKQKDEQAAAAVRSVIDVESSKQKAIVDGIGAKVDAVATTTRDVHAKVSGIHELVQRLAAQKGVVLILLLCFGAGAGGAAAWSAVSPYTDYEAAATADPILDVSTKDKPQCTRDADCPPPQYCSGGVCCRNALSKDPRCRRPASPHSGDVFRDAVEPATVDRWFTAL